MFNLTENEQKVVDFLLRNFEQDFSINEIGKQLHLSPRGIYKILKKLESEKILFPRKIGTAIYYKINFENETAQKISELVLLSDKVNSYVKVQEKDFLTLKENSCAGLLFGSIITKGNKANDIDVMIVIQDENYKNSLKEIKTRLDTIKKIKPKKIDDIVLTMSDLQKNIIQKDAVIMDLLKNAKVMWGSEIIVEVIKNASSR